MSRQALDATDAPRALKVDGVFRLPLDKRASTKRQLTTEEVDVFRVFVGVGDDFNNLHFFSGAIPVGFDSRLCDNQLAHNGNYSDEH